MKQAAEVVQPGRAEGLAVAGVVPDEAKLCRHEGEEQRDQTFQPEGLARGDEGHDGHDDQAIYDQDARQRPPWSLLEQPLLLDQPLQLGVRCVIRALSDNLYLRCPGLRHHELLLSTPPPAGGLPILRSRRVRERGHSLCFGVMFRHDDSA